jgi:hypothetical protein
MTYEGSIYTSISLELTIINEFELAQIPSVLHLYQFPENRAEIPQSRLATRLITCTHVLQILKVLETDEERLDRLKALFENVSDDGGNWTSINEQSHTSLSVNHLAFCPTAVQGCSRCPYSGRREF